MTDNINKKEKTIISEIIENHKEKFGYLFDHLKVIEVSSREFTGVGLYVNFTYMEDITGDPIKHSENANLSSNKYLNIDNLKFGLNHELRVSNGRIKYLELVTNGEAWDGQIKSLIFE